MATDAYRPPELAPETFRLLKDQRFVRYSWAKFLSLLAQNALIYGLFIDVINAQESSVVTALFVVASVVPSIVFSLPGGLFSDLVPNKFALLSILVIRIAIVFLFLDHASSIEAVIGLTFLVWSVYQFFSPAENAAVLAIVPREHFAPASSLLQATSLAAQLAGAGIVAPLALEFLDAEGLYMIVLGLLLTSTVLYAMVPNLSTQQEHEARRLSLWRALPVGYRTIAADAHLTSVTAMRILLDTGMMAFIVCAPVFIEDTLNTGAQNAVYIAIPGALGIATGLLIAPALIALIGARPVVAGGFVTFVLVLLLLPFVDSIAPELTRTLGPFRTIQEWVGVSDGIAATMMLLPIAGLGVSFVQVGARTEVYQRTPGNVIAQVFATQSALGSIAALLPTFLVGVLLDILPVRAVLIIIGTVLTAVAVNAWWRWRRAPRSEPAT